MKYYHATTESNWSSIFESGEIRPGFDKIVYLADSDLNARKFIALRAFGQPMIVIEISFPEDEEKRIEETFDHNHKFFQCNAYGYPGSIPLDWFESVTRYE